MFYVEHMRGVTMNISEVENINDIMSLNKDELKELLKQLREINRSRARALQKLEKETGYTSPALSHYKREKSIKGKSLNELRNIFKKEYGFYNAKTSTVTGAKQYKKEVEDRFGEGATTAGFWEAFEYFKAHSEYLHLLDPSDQIKKCERFYDPSKTLDEMLKEIDEYLSGVYGEDQNAYSTQEWNDYFNDF